MDRVDNALGRERTARQRLSARLAPSAQAAAALVCGLQAQDAAAGRLGVRARSATVTDADVRAAIEQRRLVKTSVMRATIHLVAAEDVRWLTALTGPVNARSFAKRWTDLGLTPALLGRSLDALPEVLADGPASRPEIVAGLARRGVRIDLGPQAATHALFHATTAGLVCRGPDRGREATFVLLDDWLPDGPTGPDGDEALAELARRYFAAFSPATAADFTAWSGLPSGRAIAALRDELESTTVDGRPGFRLGAGADSGPAPGRLRLLPAWDNYLVGYRHRDAIVAAADRAQVYVGGLIKASVVLDGRVVGSWRLNPPPTGAGDDRALIVEVTLFSGHPRVSRRALAAEAADIGRFLGRPARLLL